MPNPNYLRPQFSLRTVFVVTALCAIILAVSVALGRDLAFGFSGFVFSISFVLLAVIALAPIDRVVAGLNYPASFVPLLYFILSLSFFWLIAWRVPRKVQLPRRLDSWSSPFYFSFHSGSAQCVNRPVAEAWSAEAEDVIACIETGQWPEPDAADRWIDNTQRGESARD